MSDEKKFLTDLSDSLDSKMNYSDISKYVNVEKYKKDKKVNKLVLKISLALSTVLALSLSIFLIIDNLPTKQIETAGTPYDGIISQDFKNGNYAGPYYGDFGPLPVPPIIDGYFAEEYNVDNYEFPVDLRTFEYLYEVEYSNASSSFIAAYIKKSKAEKIYEAYKRVDDATPASPLECVDGTIVMWFHGHEFYNEKDIIWYEYGSPDFISSEINGYICLGVYRTQTRIITKEIFTNTKVNIIDEIYQKVFFSNDGNDFLTPVRYELDDSTEWYAYHTEVNDENKKYMFASDYTYNLGVIIDKENDVISLDSLINLYYEGKISTDNEELMKFYELANELKVDGIDNQYDCHFKYNEFVLLLQNLAKKE